MISAELQTLNRLSKFLDQLSLQPFVNRKARELAVDLELSATSAGIDVQTDTSVDSQLTGRIEFSVQPENLRPLKTLLEQKLEKEINDD